MSTVESNSARLQSEDLVDGPCGQASNVKIGSHVCFRPDRESWMTAALYSEVSPNYLTGMVSRQRRVKGGNGAVEFEVRWTSTRYQTKKHVHYVSYDKASEGVINHARAVGIELGPNAWDALCRPYHEAQEIDDIWDDFVEIDEANARFEGAEELPEDQAEVEKIAEMEFYANAALEAPTDLLRVKTAPSTQGCMENTSLFSSTLLYRVSSLTCQSRSGRR